MYRRLHTSRTRATRHALGGIVLGALTLGGCTQATRHANMMIFGTNTTLGISAGKDVDTPSITVGYKRQELVLMPLVANEGTNNVHELSPCKMSVTTGTAQPNHPCLLAATRSTGPDSVAKDSYSVLASFGAHFDGSARATDATLKGGLAQYFATGMAAQLLALNGGAAVVAIGGAAEASAEKVTSPDAVAALTGDPALVAAMADPAVRKRGQDRSARVSAAATAAAAYLDKFPDDATFKQEIVDLDKAAGGKGALPLVCPGDKASCIAAIKGGSLNLIDDLDLLDAAIKVRAHEKEG